jgi:hypothetical protein
MQCVTVNRDRANRFAASSLQDHRLLGEIGSRFENGHSDGPATLRKLQTALEARGVEFTNGKSPGVRLIER